MIQYKGMEPSDNSTWPANNNPNPPAPTPSSMKTLIILCVVLALALAGVFLFVRLLPPAPSQTVEAPAALSDYDSGNLDAAIFKSEAAIAQNNADIGALLLLATAYAEKGSVSFNEDNYGQKAIDTANKVLAIDPNNSEAYRIIGYANEIMQKYDEARKNYDKAIELDPKKSQTLSNKGNSYDLQGDMKNAEIWYDKALAINPNDEHALLKKARVLARLGKSEEALDILDSIFDTGANKRFLAEADQLYAFVLINQKEADYEGAEEAIKESLSYDSGVPQSWVMLAMIKLHNTINLATQDELDAAITEINDALEKALEINPDRASAYYIASKAATIVGDEAKAAIARRKALDAIPLDITLGAAEKEDLRATIESFVK